MLHGHERSCSFSGEVSLETGIRGAHACCLNPPTHCTALHIFLSRLPFNAETDDEPIRLLIFLSSIPTAASIACCILDVDEVTRPRKSCITVGRLAQNQRGLLLHVKGQRLVAQATTSSLATATTKATNSSSDNGESYKQHPSMSKEPAILSLNSGRNYTWSDDERKLQAFARPSDSSVDDRGRLDSLRLRQRQQ
ncbi:hypothetical protein GW17_00012120 [Ensete ventricosum]|uniref:Uncharacterized protein n=1 Tax=Ensete ventricosum TaxID=4639 RepID=A0A444FLV5_ENSVE|nr:hypothetical protein GW17_00012120 [Ensete ventricosum]RZR71319.1 hypothetical protein BHM03_00004608 [Ensete ventricosum]